MTTQTAIHTQGLTKHYGTVEALIDLDLDGAVVLGQALGVDGGLSGHASPLPGCSGDGFWGS